MKAITSAIAKPLGMLLFFLNSFVGNYGIAIILFTIIVKAALYPLTAHQLKATKKMQDIQPKIQELQKKYANNKEQLNVKLMELYKQENVNPAGGCLPLLIQMPIIIGLFSLLRTPSDYVTDPTLLQAVTDSFLWIPDLSQPDKWILPILAGVSTYFSFQLSNNSTAAQNPSLKIMQYMFPLLIIWWGRSFPAGLTLYWFVSTLFQLGQQFLTNRVKAAKEDLE